MDEAARRAAELRRPTWIFAERQSHSRGRRGRPWIAPRGAFAATLSLPNPGSALAAAQRSFVAALALRDMTAQLLAPVRIGLKWPNDVLIDGRKFAGILLETKSSGGPPSHVAVGIGLNMGQTPDPAALEPHAVPPIGMDEALGKPFDAPQTTVLAALATSYAHWEQVFVRDGFGPIRAAWLADAASLGRMITARIGQTATHGTFQSIDDTGALVLATPGGEKVISAAEIYL